MSRVQIKGFATRCARVEGTDVGLARSVNVHRAAGFRLQALFGALDESVPIDAETAWRLVAVLQKQAPQAGA